MTAGVRRALVTGGGGDIGAAVCRRLAAAGLHVVVHGRSAERVEAVCKHIITAGGSAETVLFDVTDRRSAGDQLARLLAAGPIQVLVNNAGIYRDAPLAGMRGDDWDRVIEVALRGFYNVTQPLLLPMMATRWGRIVSVSSVTGVIGNRGQSNYAAAKAGLHGASKSLALELASRGVTVNVVAPGIIQGRIASEEFDPQLIKQLVPMNRPGKPEEVASLVGFLASDEAGYISGQVININGGMA